MRKILKRLTCLARGHQRVRFIDRLSNIRTDGFGGVQATVESSHFECSRCGATLEA